jgi:signal peptidase II
MTSQGHDAPAGGAESPPPARKPVASPAAPRAPKSPSAADSPSTAPKGRRWTVAFYGIAVAVWLLDRLTKWWAVQHVGFGKSAPLLGPILSITPVRNENAAWSVPVPAVALIVLGAVVALVLLLYGARAASRSISLVVALSLALGGAAANLYDRLRWSYVIDFIDVHFWPTFNVADIAITVGTILIAFHLLRHRRREDAGERPPPQQE